MCFTHARANLQTLRRRWPGGLASIRTCVVIALIVRSLRGKAFPVEMRDQRCCLRTMSARARVICKRCSRVQASLRRTSGGADDERCIRISSVGLVSTGRVCFHAFGHNARACLFVLLPTGARTPTSVALSPICGCRPKASSQSAAPDLARWNRGSQRSVRSRRRCAAILVAQRFEPNNRAEFVRLDNRQRVEFSRFTSRRPPRQFTENSQPGHARRIDVKARMRDFSRIQNFVFVDMQGIGLHFDFSRISFHEGRTRPIGNVRRDGNFQRKLSGKFPLKYDVSTSKRRMCQPRQAARCTNHGLAARLRVSQPSCIPSIGPAELSCCASQRHVARIDDQAAVLDGGEVEFRPPVDCRPSNERGNSTSPPSSTAAWSSIERHVLWLAQQLNSPGDRRNA